MTAILLNGEPKHISEHSTVLQLVDTLGLAGKRIAVECNQEIVPKPDYATTRLCEGDVVEIVQAIGGG